MIKSNKTEGLYYVNDYLKGVYELFKNGRTHHEALEVYGIASVEEYIATVRETEGRTVRKFLVHDQTEAFKVGLKIAAQGTSEIKAVLIPEYSVVAPGFMELVPKAFRPRHDLTVLGELPLVKRYKKL